MKFRRQARESLSVNLTPLIDVVFLLLIFFMVSTTFTRETQLSVDLPEATGLARDEVAQQIEILNDEALGVEGRHDDAPGHFRGCAGRAPGRGARHGRRGTDGLHAPEHRVDPATRRRLRPRSCAA